MPARAMFGSPAITKDLSLSFCMPPFKQGKEETGLSHQHQQQQMATGLLRYRSAPSSLLSDMCEDVLPHRPSSPEADTALARFVSPGLGEQIGQKPSLTEGILASAHYRSPQFIPMSTMGGAAETLQHQQGAFLSSAAQMMYHAAPPPPPPPQQHTSYSSAATSSESSFPAASSMAMDNKQVKTGVNCSNIIRHSSSPAGFFSHLGMENGFDVTRSMGGFPGSSSKGEGPSGGSRLKEQINFSSRQPASGLISQVAEIGGEGLDGDGGLEDRGLGQGNGRGFIPGFPVCSWDDTSLFSDSFSTLKRPRDTSETQNGDINKHFPGLSCHLSLPKDSPEMAAILQFQDAVPCKIRAKRGCATHPRSIAERMRRTRISERMRKLQELVPNMDKQTNTADMLDLALEYIKDLQKQAQRLSESKANCTCSW